jgi:hypothetical protein
VGPKKGGGTSVNFRCSGNQWTDDFTLNKWHQLAMHIVWSEDPAKGHVKLWWDGNVVLDKNLKNKGPETYYFTEPGIQRGGAKASEDCIYYDNFIMATTLPELEIMKPAQAANATGRRGAPILDLLEFSRGLAIVARR